MKVSVIHVTRLDFGGEVSETVMDAHLGPRNDSDQRVERFVVRLEPAGHVRRYEDGFGNVAHQLTSMRPHAFLQVTAETHVETYMSDPFQLAPRPPQPLDVIHLADCLDPSPLVPRVPVVEAMAAPFRSEANANAFEAIQRMSEVIHRDFSYQTGVTDVTTSIEQIVAGRQGVCQDFAHLLLGMCRAIGIPSRYASGYIVERDQSGAGTPSRGVGASHAWVEAFTPTHGWRGFDPTNNLVANDYYVKIAVGRDYSDVPPTRGTYHGGPDEHLSVAVTARAID
jgi:transglutaminase-like putative cysteine protease